MIAGCNSLERRADGISSPLIGMLRYQSMSVDFLEL